MAALDPVAYLRSTPPFDALPPSLFDGVAGDVEVVYHPAGARLVHVGGEPLKHLYVIRKGSVRIERDGQSLQLLEEGETFGYTSLISRTANLDVQVEEDLVAYRLPDAQFQRLLRHAPFAGHFAVGMAERLRSSLELSPVTTFRPDLSIEVQQLVRRPAAWLPADATVGDAARTMRDQDVSSVMVRTEPPRIVTDRDFRSRVLAAGLGPEEPVTRIATSPLRTVPATARIFEAWRMLLDSGLHHLAVVRGAEVIGVVDSIDLLRATTQDPLAVLRGVERLPSREALPGYGRRVSEMASAMLAGGLEPIVIAGFVARLNDALLVRILRWAEADLGPPPVPYAWLAFGSEGRMEQTLLTDQDNALVFADEGAAHLDWFRRLTERANGDLEAAGFPHCPGGYMASKWHGSLSEWKGRFGHWEDDPVPQALLEASIFFDFRRVSGLLDLAPLEAVVAEASGKPVFLRFLAQAALGFRTPQALLLRLKGESSTVDLKLQGISPIVFLARVYGLEVGSTARNTLARLQGAHGAGLMGEEAFGSVSEAYRFLLGLRLRLQLRMLADGRQVTNVVALSELNAIERSRLKDSFRAIKAWQEKAAYHYQLDF